MRFPCPDPPERRERIDLDGRGDRRGHAAVQLGEDVPDQQRRREVQRHGLRFHRIVAGELRGHDRPPGVAVGAVQVHATQARRAPGLDERPDHHVEFTREHRHVGHVLAHERRGPPGVGDAGRDEDGDVRPRVAACANPHARLRTAQRTDAGDPAGYAHVRGEVAGRADVGRAHRRVVVQQDRPDASSREQGADRDAEPVGTEHGHARRGTGTNRPPGGAPDAHGAFPERPVGEVRGVVRLDDDAGAQKGLHERRGPVGADPVRPGGSPQIGPVLDRPDEALAQRLLTAGEAPERERPARVGAELGDAVLAPQHPDP
ncbi:hypothetical protein [Beutenbergia cavernae]|uniref:hypothetical protein n=1 Tax=Beutenbergia cavernae TaxID=84757 RepID=UPI00117E0059|nr:hypothetical protein [Beutenbergia cavernae]